MRVSKAIEVELQDKAQKQVGLWGIFEVGAQGQKFLLLLMKKQAKTEWKYLRQGAVEAGAEKK